LSVPPTNPPQQWPHEERWPYEQQANRAMSGALLTILTRASQHLIAHARDLSARGTTTTEFQLAVIFAQSACELLTEEALGDLLRSAMSEKLQEAVRSTFRRPVTLADKQPYKLWVALTDDAARNQAWWAAWKATRDLRHEVAHSGKAVSQPEAADCVARADEYMGHLSRTVSARLQR
jgi:hypothetical protein